MNTDMRLFEEDYIWIEDNRAQFIRRYPNQWIAVKDHRIIANNPNLEDLLRQLPDPSHTAVDFITPEHREVVLWR